jgi:hypothetical protein
LVFWALMPLFSILKWRLYVPLERRCVSKSEHGATTQNNNVTSAAFGIPYVTITKIAELLNQCKVYFNDQTQ